MNLFFSYSNKKLKSLRFLSSVVALVSAYVVLCVYMSKHA